MHTWTMVATWWLEFEFGRFVSPRRRFYVMLLMMNLMNRFSVFLVSRRFVFFPRRFVDARRRKRRRRSHLASIRQLVNRRIRRPLRMMFTVLVMFMMFRDEPVILVLVSRSLRGLRCLRLQVTERRLVLVFRRSVNPRRHLDTRR